MIIFDWYTSFIRLIGTCIVTFFFAVWLYRMRTSFTVWEFRMVTFAPTQHPRGIVVIPHQGQLYLVPLSFCLQAMWRMCAVKEPYLHYEEAGNQFLGHVVSELNCNSYLFVTSSPHFDFTGIENERNIKHNLDALVEEYVPRGDHLKSRIFWIFCYCFASLYVDFLRQKLHKKQAAQLSFLYSSPREGQDLAKVRFPWNAIENTQAFIGKLNFGFILHFLFTY